MLFDKEKEEYATYCMMTYPLIYEVHDFLSKIYRQATTPEQVITL